MFKDRAEAGELLATTLEDYRDKENTIIVALPRGGVPIGYAIAKHLNLPLEVVLSKKIGHPYHKEFAIGAVTLESRTLSEDIYDISRTYIDEETKRMRDLLIERQRMYYGKKTPLNFKNKIVIVVDDGVATGQTLMSSIKLIEQKKPSQIIVALPVAPPSSIKKIKKIESIRQLICLEIPNDFSSVGQFYEEFTQVSDQEVIRLLKDVKSNGFKKDINL